VKNTGYEVHHYAIFSMFHLPRFMSEYPPQHSVLKNPQFMFLHQNERSKLPKIYVMHMESKGLSCIVVMYLKLSTCVGLLTQGTKMQPLSTTNEGVLCSQLVIII